MRKLENKSEALMLIGYDPIGAYKLYDPIQMKLIMSKYVII